MSIVDNFDKKTKHTPFLPKIYTSGTVLRVEDNIAWADGLSMVSYWEIVKFENGKIGLVGELRQREVGILLLDERDINVGLKVYGTGKEPSVPVGEELLGRVIDPFGNPLDGRGPTSTSEYTPMERAAPPISWRAKVNEPVETGIYAIDLLVPVGHGQRELILGDRSTGKTSLAIDILINQKGKNVIGVYVSIGQKESDLSNVVETLDEHGVLNQIVIVAAPAAFSPMLRFLAPYAGTSIAEWFMYRGKKVIIIYDDLTKHAISYREISLLLRRPPGREAYPGDIFYAHSKLLERAAKLNYKHGEGSLTAFPICETQLGDFSSYIPTNLISITDGQIYLDTNLFNSGRRPAVHPGLSVSRVGGAAQYKAIKKFASKLRIDLARYEELSTFVQFGGKLDEKSEKLLQRGKRTVELLKQKVHQLATPVQEVIALILLTEGILDDVEANKVTDMLWRFYKYIQSIQEEIHINPNEEVDTKTKKRIIELWKKFARDIYAQYQGS